MKASILLTAIAAVVAFTSVVSARESKVWGRSPSKYITWSVDPATSELYFSNQEGSSSKLCDVTAPSALKLTFSPDERYVFVTDGSSIGTRVSLYKRSSGVHYSKVSGYDFDLATQRLALQVETGKDISSTVLKSSRYLDCTGWSKDGQWAYLRLSGEGSIDGRKVEIDGFKCSFNPSRGEFTNR
ncbi:MAG: hypothetical protein ACAH88_13955 [Roseimicrobium sp.]